MRRSLFFSAVAAAPLLLSAVPASAGKFHGQYMLTYFGGPTHVETAQQCLDFTNTGNVLGFADSGTWDSPTFSGWGGNFVMDHGTLRFYGTFNSGASVTNHYATKDKGMKTMSGGFDDWAASAPPIEPVNDGTISLVKGCTKNAHPPIRQSASPTRAD